MLESPVVGADLALTADDRAALHMENSELRARVEAREQRNRLLEEALRVLKANTYGPSRERLSAAAGQVELFNGIEATLKVTEAVGIEQINSGAECRGQTYGRTLLIGTNAKYSRLISSRKCWNNRHFHRTPSLSSSSLRRTALKSTYWSFLQAFRS
jgi:transposase IS166 family protein